MWVVPHAAGLAPRYGQVDFTLADRRNDWLVIASGREHLASPIALWQDATCSVTHLDAAKRTCVLEAGRYGFLFVAKGEVEITDGGEFITTLQAGDALRLIDDRPLEVQGSGELVLWDTV